jgi:hypothetical protein
MTRHKIMTKNVHPGKYHHYKGKLYEVIGTVRHSETLEELVLYKTLYKNKTSALWVRPVKMFLEDVEVDGKKIPRFKRCL